MSTPYYPTLNLGSLASLMTLRQQMETHDDYLDRDECPYDIDTRDQLRRLMAKQVVEVPVQTIVEKIVERRIEVAAKAAEGGGQRGPKPKLKGSGASVDDVSKEIDDIRHELKNLKMESKNLQTADKIQIIKTRAALVEKMLAMTERANNVKRMNLFQSTVMSILDDYVADEHRQIFMERLEPFATAED